MKIGIISDTHSNIDALKAVFDEFEKRKIDKLICLGDTIGIGPFPKQCMDFLLERKNMFLGYIRGNHENYILKGIPERNHNEPNERLLTEEEKDTHRWNHSWLTPEQKEFIKSLPIRDVIEVEGKKIVLEHYPMDKKDKFKKFYNKPTMEQLKDIFDIKDADVYLFGHTHNNSLYRDGERLFINPGSVGCPINTNCACAGILTIEDGKADYEQLNVNYDVEKVINDIKEINYPLNWFMIKLFFRG